MIHLLSAVNGRERLSLATLPYPRLCHITKKKNHYHNTGRHKHDGQKVFQRSYEFAVHLKYKLHKTTVQLTANKTSMKNTAAEATSFAFLGRSCFCGDARLTTASYRLTNPNATATTTAALNFNFDLRANLTIMLPVPLHLRQSTSREKKSGVFPNIHVYSEASANAFDKT